MNFFLAPLFIQPPPICHWGDSGPDLRRNLTEEEPGSPQLQPQPDQQLPWKVSRCWGGQEVCEAIQPLQAKFILREVLHIRSQRCPPNKQHLFKTRSVQEEQGKKVCKVTAVRCAFLFLFAGLRGRDIVKWLPPPPPEEEAALVSC